jgi:hypothetical protein
MDRKRTLRDTNQINSAEHYEEFDARRVYIVNGEMPTINVPEIKIPEIKMPEIKTIEVPVIVIQKELQVEKIEVPVVIKETEIKEVQTQVVVVDKQLQIERVEIPVVQKEIEIIEKPVVITEYKDLPKWVNVLLVAQALTSILMLLKK